MNESIRLLSDKNGADKEYRVQLEARDDGFIVTGFNGRRGGALKAQPKTSSPVPYEEAKAAYDALVKAKIKGGYVPDADSGDYVAPAEIGTPTGINLHLLSQVPETEVMRYIHDHNFLAQEKFDGERRPVACLDTVIGSNKLGFQSTLPGRVVEALGALPEGTVLDAEQIGDVLYVFDMMQLGGQCLRNQSCLTRNDMLNDVIVRQVEGSSVVAVASAIGTEAKLALYERLRAERKEGIVFKHIAAPYAEGKNEDQIKVKFVESATVQVASVHPTKRSVRVQVFDAQGVTVDLGSVLIPSNHAVPAVGALVEIGYLYVVRRFVQPVYKGTRTDQTLAACSTAQLKYRAGIDGDALEAASADPLAA